MPKPVPFSPLRLFTPIQLIFALILFFLPWIEIQCVPPKELVKDLPKEQLQKLQKETGIDPTRPRPLVSQSGFQIATGKFSIVDPDLKKLEELGKDAEQKAKGGNGTITRSKDKDDEPDKAPLLFVYALAVLAGIVLGFVLGPGMPRRLILAGCCGGALAILGLQILIGFPVENQMKKQMEKQRQVEQQFGGAGAGAAKGKMESPFRVSWQYGLFLTFFILLGAAGTSFLDGGTGATRYKRRSRNRDDDDDDDEDDRPRRKKRYEDDDDRPRKKRQKVYSLDDEEEEEEAEPPKRRRREEDEDERPARKKPPTAESDNPFAFDDDEPRRKKPRPRDDDEDDDDRPRRKRRRDDD